MMQLSETEKLINERMAHRWIGPDVSSRGRVEAMWLTRTTSESVTSVGKIAKLIL